MCAVTALPSLDRGLVLEPEGEHPRGLSIPPTQHVCTRDPSECVCAKGPWVVGRGLRGPLGRWEARLWNIRSTQRTPCY